MPQKGQDDVVFNNSIRGFLLMFADKFGFNSLLVLAMFYGLWIMGNRIVESHVQFMVVSQESMKTQTKALDLLVVSDREKVLVLEKLLDSSNAQMKALERIEKKLP